MPKPENDVTHTQKKSQANTGEEVEESSTKY